MTKITKDLLEQLEKLAALDLSEEQQKKLQPQLQEIVAMVEKLQDFPLEEDAKDDTVGITLNSGVESSMDSEELLQNVDHPVNSDMITIETSTNE